jgi:hypothetical protein
MKRLLLLVLVGLAVAPCLRAESLGNAAKREEERRKKIVEDGKAPSPVIDDTELSLNKGKVANDVNAVPAAPADVPSVGSRSFARSSVSAGGSKNQNDAVLAGWAARGAALEVQIAVAEKAVAAAKDAPVTTGGSRDRASYEVARKAHEEGVRRAQEQLNAVRRQLEGLEDEARRAGIAPGVLRGQTP